MKLLMISTDRKIFDKNSPVSMRQMEYAKKYEEVHIIVFTRKAHNLSETVLGQNIWVYPTNSLSRWLYVFDALKLGKFISKKRKITDMTCQDPFETGLVGALIKNHKPISLEIQIHTDIGSPYFKKFNYLNRIRTLISKFTLPKADHIRVVSYRIQEYVSTVADPSHIEVRPIPVDTEKIKNSSITINLHNKYSQFSKIVLMASRLEAEKNIDLAIRSWKTVMKTIPEAGLIIVGSGSQKKLLQGLVAEIEGESSVIFEDWQNDIASYYKTCDCFLVSSLYEGYGMTLVEAHAAGSKIVSTDVGVAREMGAQIVEHTPESMARGIMDAIS